VRRGRREDQSAGAFYYCWRAPSEPIRAWQMGAMKIWQKVCSGEEHLCAETLTAATVPTVYITLLSLLYCCKWARIQR
ncbi:unnamed protein product, partial [Chrysoparadoxa australica]